MICSCCGSILPLVQFGILVNVLTYDDEYNKGKYRLVARLKLNHSNDIALLLLMTCLLSISYQYFLSQCTLFAFLF